MHGKLFEISGPDLWYPDPHPSADFWWQELDSMNAALQERLKTAELLRTEALAQVPFRPQFSSFLANINKAVVLTEAIVETFNELKDAVMTHDIKIIFVWWDSKDLSNNYYGIPSRLHILDWLAGISSNYLGSVFD